MSPFELILAVNTYCEGDNAETILEINDLISKIGVHNKFAYELSTALEEFATIHNRCHVCSSDDLETVVYKEPRGEYFGMPCMEEIHIKYCSECGSEI